jgi:hypothetical protein
MGPEDLQRIGRKTIRIKIFRADLQRALQGGNVGAENR